jgi:hypothetical protein
LPIKFIKDAYWRDIYQASPRATPATDTAQIPVSLQDIFSLAHKAMALTHGAFLPEIMPACHSGEFVELA